MQLQSVVGYFFLVGLAWLMSANRRRIPWRTVAGGILLQVALGVLLLRVPASRVVFLTLNRAMEALTKAIEAGTSAVLGYVGGGAPPFQVTEAANAYIFAFRALPLIILMSAISSLLFYWRVLPAVVRGMSWVLRRSMGIGGAVGLSAAANVFLGMVEAPLLIAPYLARLTRGELFLVMTGGMATVAGSVMVLYANLLTGQVADPLGHLLTASLMSAPAGIVLASIMLPPFGDSTEAEMALPRPASGFMDAVTMGTHQGLKLFLNVTAMLIVLIALVSLANQALGLLPGFGETGLTLQKLLGLIAAPIAWMIGIPWSEAAAAGGLLGTKVVLNEFIAFVDLSRMPEALLSPRSRLIMSYALCGFANVGSIGIMIGGLGTMVPERRADIAALGPRSILSGALATCMSAALAGLLTP